MSTYVWVSEEDSCCGSSRWLSSECLLVVNAHADRCDDVAAMILDFVFDRRRRWQEAVLPAPTSLIRYRKSFRAFYRILAYSPQSALVLLHGRLWCVARGGSLRRLGSHTLCFQLFELPF